jgi:hypothetical protein
MTPLLAALVLATPDAGVDCGGTPEKMPVLFGGALHNDLSPAKGDEP